MDRETVEDTETLVDADADADVVGVLLSGEAHVCLTGGVVLIFALGDNVNEVDAVTVDVGSEADEDAEAVADADIETDAEVEKDADSFIVGAADIVTVAAVVIIADDEAKGPAVSEDVGDGSVDAEGATIVVDVVADTVSG